MECSDEGGQNRSENSLLLLNMMGGGGGGGSGYVTILITLVDIREQYKIKINK